MFDQYRNQQFKLYAEAKDYLVRHPDLLISLVHFFVSYLKSLVTANWPSIESDYNEASFLFPFWQNYPPDDRGRQPRGDQYPWIEVGEHSIGAKLPRLFSADFAIRDTGIPSGADQRFVLTSKEIAGVTQNLTDAVWLSIDVKSAGPRDDFDHAVMSHNQISGDGIWDKPDDGTKNTVLTAESSVSNHPFHCSVPPLYILSDMTIALVVNIVLKPVYKMLAIRSGSKASGQPLNRITLACIPNGILLVITPGYLKKFPGLLFPGKDDKSKNPLKVRARVSFELLRKIADWRVCTITGAASGK